MSSNIMKRKNLLFLMTDQMQGRVLDPDHQCITPNLDRLAAKSICFRNAYTSNAVCSPARAGIMTGLLPHNHGVLTVTHCADQDQSCLRTDKPHWAQRLRECGYDTAYFGKWHVEKTESPGDFGWNHDFSFRSGKYAKLGKCGFDTLSHSKKITTPGYQECYFYGVIDLPPEERRMGQAVSHALDYLHEAVEKELPWCCFVSVSEPHDPFICGKEAYAIYNPDDLKLQPNTSEGLADAPRLYQKSAQVYHDFTDREKREAAACYYASITEIDQQYGRILKFLEKSGQLDNTVIIFTSDHGELLGAHGLYCKNFSAYEEIYNIPMLISVPGVTNGEVCDGRIGSHDLCPTILELLDARPIENSDSKSFALLLKNPADTEEFQNGYAEYFGTRFYLTQRITWQDSWKYVFNGFDFDELYNLENDPYEMKNLASDPEFRPQLETMTRLMWKKIEETGDLVLLQSKYAPFRFAPVGPDS